MEDIELRESIRQAITFIQLLAEAIREAGTIPSGTLYAAVCGKCDLEAYEKAIQTLKNTGLVSERGHVLKWEGPAI